MIINSYQANMMRICGIIGDAFLALIDGPNSID